MNDLNGTEIYWWRALEDEPSPPDTRTRILFAAYQEIHLNGFQAASLSHILAHTGVTKGALYHHFPNKVELGYAVIDEVIADRIFRSFIEPLENAGDPLQGLIDLIQQAGKSFTLRDVQLGCPLSTLAQEMAPIDEGFRVRLNRIYEQWHGAIVKALNKARAAGELIDGVNKLMYCGEGLIQYLHLIRKKNIA